MILLVACSQESTDDGNFYHAKNISYIVATDPGGGFDAYARLIGKYLKKNLAADNVIIRNTPGAGHLVGAITLFRSKPDGLTIGTFNMGLIYGQIVGKPVHPLICANSSGSARRPASRVRSSYRTNARSRTWRT